MITSGYFNSSQGDRKYTAEQMSEIFDFLLNDGVLETYGEKLFTTPATSGLGVVLGSGWAWFDQTWTKNDSSIPLMLDEPDPSLSRIDTVCLVVNKSQLVRANTFQIFKGLPSLSPQPATLQNTSTIIAHPLAYVTVPADASAISATNIEILVGKSACPFITSILQTTDITTLFQGWSEQYNLAYSAWNTNFNTSLAGWEADFNTWFEHLQTYLSEDVVTNLQLQINQLKTADTNNMATLRSEIATKVNTSDKATTVNAQSGTDDTKWMTPLKVKQAVEYQVNQKFPVLGTGKILWNSQFVVQGDRPFLHDPRYMVSLESKKATDSSVKLYISIYDSDTDSFIYKASEEIPNVNVVNRFDFSYSAKYRNFSIPNLLSMGVYTSSSGNYQYPIVLNILTGAILYKAANSVNNSSSTPVLVNGNDKTFFYLVTWSGSTLSVSKYSTSGSSLGQYSIAMPQNADGLGNARLSLNTDTNGNFIIVYYNHYRLYYVKPSSSQVVSVTLSQYLNVPDGDIAYYNGYFYFASYYVNNTSGATISKVLFRYSPGSTSAPSTRSGPSGYEQIHRIYIYDNGAFVGFCNSTSNSNDNISFIYGSNISSFFSSGTCTLLKDDYGNAFVNYSCPGNNGSPNYLFLKNSIMLDCVNSKVVSGVPIIPSSATSTVSNTKHITTKKIFYSGSMMPIDMTKSNV